MAVVEDAEQSSGHYELSQERIEDEFAQSLVRSRERREQAEVTRRRIRIARYVAILFILVLVGLFLLFAF